MGLSFALRGHSGPMRSALFDPDGFRALTVSGEFGDTTSEPIASIWRNYICAPESAPKALNSARELTPDERRIYLHEGDSNVP